MKAAHVSQHDVWWALISPTAAVALSTTIAIVSIVFPRDYYERLLMEHDYIYHNASAALYIALCVAAFVAGLAFHKHLLLPYKKPKRQQEKQAGVNRIPARFLVIAIAIVFIAINVYVFVVGFNTTGLAAITSTFSGDVSSSVIRYEVEEAYSDENVGILFVASTALAPWLAWIALAISSSYRKTLLDAVAILLTLIQ